MGGRPASAFFHVLGNQGVQFPTGVWEGPLNSSWGDVQAGRSWREKIGSSIDAQRREMRGLHGHSRRLALGVSTGRARHEIDDSRGAPSHYYSAPDRDDPRCALAAGELRLRRRSDGLDPYGGLRGFRRNGYSLTSHLYGVSCICLTHFLRCDRISPTSSTFVRTVCVLDHSSTRHSVASNDHVTTSVQRHGRGWTEAAELFSHTTTVVALLSLSSDQHEGHPDPRSEGQLLVSHRRRHRE